VKSNGADKMSQQIHCRNDVIMLKSGNFEISGQFSIYNLHSSKLYQTTSKYAV